MPSPSVPTLQTIGLPALSDEDMDMGNDFTAEPPGVQIASCIRLMLALNISTPVLREPSIQRDDVGR
ncbi:hypothetical protein Syun_001662 [Stephania yunnanensis]|uniref:Uncharacterized protein n=1 Tax=Stephania yunnanensis TaxID=152371 RepID=A0AAP0Q6H9_9MAGN